MLGRSVTKKITKATRTLRAGLQTVLCWVAEVKVKSTPRTGREDKICAEWRTTKKHRKLHKHLERLEVLLGERATEQLIKSYSKQIS